MRHLKPTRFTNFPFLPILIILLIYPSDGYAQTNALGKLRRGVVNIPTSVFEIPKQARAYWVEGAQKTDHILVWIFAGTIKGIVEMTKRASSGLWDIGSFPWAVPKEYEPLLKPDYVFENWPHNPISGK